MADPSAQSASENAPSGRLMPTAPRINTLRVGDIGAILVAGLRDFAKAPLYGLTFGAIYAVGGLLIVYFLTAFDVPFLAYPAASGFALIAPFVAAGVYEVSRRLEQDAPLSWSAILSVVWGQNRRDLGWMAVITFFSYYIWVDLAGIIYLLFFGLRELDFGIFVHALFNTPRGYMFLLLGNAAGAVMALIVFSVTVVSFPLLLDRNIDFVTAMVTSVKAVQANPVPMLAWCAIIAIVLFASIATAFIALVVSLPILGHASWHLYRRTVSFDVKVT